MKSGSVFNFSGTDKRRYRGRHPNVYAVVNVDIWRAACLCVPNHPVIVLVDLTDSLDNAVSLGVTLKNPVSHIARMVTPSLSRHAGVGVMRLDDYPCLDGRRLHNDGPRFPHSEVSSKCHSRGSTKCSPLILHSGPSGP
jgi:hypothetical protein